ncbi:DUF3579 domain-containing protein [Parasulfuritortus cantonensis]|uniref:DUF3579 domain-containing protein n=1 Tax=Parasulfuritortus cantonensis TaxID=2528202 RepID=A0A4R1B4F0_9PROT|nr:DUF3579 domain-containing protein [Parasulfuritortus cantonensis]TCJ12974.1 DUF3579 domain-containing protein [Parasulfuritortus cantonensis]
MTEACLERTGSEATPAEPPAADALFILGQTRAGKPFRPSDWVDRMAGLFATFGEDKTLRYSPLVHPATLDGVRGLWLDAHLRERDPSAYAFIMAFADSQQLAIRPAHGAVPASH